MKPMRNYVKTYFRNLIKTYGIQSVDERPENVIETLNLIGMMISQVYGNIWHEKKMNLSNIED